MYSFEHNVFVAERQQRLDFVLQYGSDSNLPNTEHKWNYLKGHPPTTKNKADSFQLISRNIRQRICGPFLNERFFCSFYHLSFVNFVNGILAFFPCHRSSHASFG